VVKEFVVRVCMRAARDNEVPRALRQHARPPQVRGAAGNCCQVQCRGPGGRPGQARRARPAACLCSRVCERVCACVRRVPNTRKACGRGAAEGAAG